jgi:AraC-like DNA-binding protein
MINRYLYLVLFSLPNLLFGQDTNFINRHTFPAPVRNVFLVDSIVHVKTGNGLYKLEHGQWIPEKMKFTKPFVFSDKGFYETDYIPNQYIFDARQMAYLIPQRALANGTIAKTGDHFFVAAGGSLFEYSVTNFYKHVYKDYSIRDIYLEPGLKVLSTYAGIYINDTGRAREPGYSNGSFSKINGRYYLSSDQLYRYSPDSGFLKIASGTNVFAGHSRKLVAWQHQVFAQHTKSINQVDSNYELRPIHQGFEYYDIEAADSVLLFSTFTGEVFQYDGKAVKLLVKLPTRVRDIYIFKNLIYLSSDEGVFTLTNSDPGTLRQLTQTPVTVNVVVDLLNNTWIATENGLYVIPDKSSEAVLFIPDVEFNRGALNYFEDTIYAGSIEGLYMINTYSVVKNFLPQYLNKKNLDESEQHRKQLLFGLLALVIIFGFGYFYKNRRKAHTEIAIPQKEEPGLTLDKIRQDIMLHNIMTVEGLAEFYHTNTVQLNRQFKTFDTTPGRFMKQVKLDHARDLLKLGISMEEVVAKVGYSAIYLKKEL